MTFHVAGSKVRMARMDFTDTILTVMNKITKNKIAMYKAVRTIIETNQANWSELPAFASAVQTFDQRLDALEQAAYHQNLALVGVSAVKNAKRSIVAEKAYAMSSSMVAFAVVTDNVELVNHMKIAKHELDNCSKDKMLILVDRIITRASELVNLLVDYGIDQASIDELQLLRDELDAQMNAPRNAIIDRKGQTARIKSLVRELDAILKFQLDKLLFILKEDHPQFFIAYSNARLIVDHKNRTSGNASLPPERDDGFRPPRFGEEDPE